MGKEEDFPVIAPTESETVRGLRASDNVAVSYSMAGLRARLNAIAQSFAALITFNAGIATDSVAEKTVSAGVTVDGVELKDGLVNGVQMTGGAVVGYLPQNGIINGDHRINQLGLSSAIAAVNSTYQGPDQWESLFNGVTATIELVTANQPSSLSGSNSLKMAATSTASGKIGQLQRFEDFELFSGKTVTFAFYVKSNNSNARVRLNDGTTSFISNTHTGGGNWELLFTTATLAASVSALNIFPRITDATGTGDVSITSGDYIEFTGAGLVLGSQVIPFTSRDTETEQDKSFRYKFRKANGATDPDEYIANGGAISTTQAEGFIQFPKPMIEGPVLSVSGVTHFAVRDSGVDITTTALTISDATERGCKFLATVAGGLVDGHSIQLKIDGNATAFMDFNAQL